MSAELKFPVCDTSDPAELAAWYGPFGYSDHWRKVCLANCREIIRAGASLGSQKISEARIDDLARTHSIYIDFLTTNLHGRRLYEEEIRTANRGGYGR